MLCPVYGHELTPLSCPPHQGVSFRSFKGLIILSPYNDSRSLIDALHQQGCEAVIPSRRTNHHPRTIDRHLYKERHLIETFFNKIKEYRKIATRYDKLAEVFAAFVCLAASLIWLR